MAARGVFRIDSYDGDKNTPAPATPSDVPFVIVLLITSEITTDEVIMSNFVFILFIQTSVTLHTIC